ncbi:MAG: DUF819 family protein [Neisseria animaloris]|nr:DUF819 family protein [Neisseria animaloris]
METLIKPDDTLLLWAFVMLAAGAAVVMEQRAKWAAKVPGAVTALLMAIAASNFGLVPTDASVYDAVWGYIVPLAIPLLLFQLDIRSVFRESGRLLLLFFISSVGTVLGVLAGFSLLKDRIPELDKVSAMIAASYTGGGVNFAAMTAKLEPSKDITSATVVADNLMMACYFLILITLAASGFARRVWGSPYSNEAEQFSDGQNQAAAFWKPKAVSLESIALSLGGAILLVAVSFTLSKFLKGVLSADGNIALEVLFSLLTDKYLLLTTLTFAVIWLFPRQTAQLNGSQELGMYCIFLFFVVIGVPASIPLILQNTPLLFVFTLTVAVINLAVTLLAGKLFKYSIEEIVLACNANIGGPTTAAALAIGQGWRSLVGPILVIGTAGYIIGNYIGSLVYAMLA